MTTSSIELRLTDALRLLEHGAPAAEGLVLALIREARILGDQELVRKGLEALLLNAYVNKNPRKRLRWARALLALRPRHPRYAIVVALLEQARGNLPRAQTLLRRAIWLCHNNADQLFDLEVPTSHQKAALIIQWRQQLATAELATNSSLRALLGDVADDDGRLDAYLERTIRDAFTRISRSAEIAQPAFKRLHKIALAVGRQRHAIQALHGLLWCARGLGLDDKHQAHLLRRLVRMEPENPRNWANLAELELEHQRTVRGVRHLRKALAVAHGQPAPEFLASFESRNDFEALLARWVATLETVDLSRPSDPDRG